MLGILLVAFAIGAVIRFNIIHAEPLLADVGHSHAVKPLQRLSDLALGFAYIVSVTFYVRLLASFVLRFGGHRDAVIENVLTTVVLLFIAIVGWKNGRSRGGDQAGHHRCIADRSVRVRLALALQ